MGSRIKTLWAVVWLLAAIGFAAPARANVATEVTVNKSILLNLQEPSERVSIAVPEIAELVVISPRQLQINGRNIGATSLIVWEKGGKTTFFDVRVKGDVAQLDNQIREIAPNDSITVDYANDTIVLAGKAANEETIAKVVAIAQAYAAKETGKPAPVNYGDQPAAVNNNVGGDRTFQREGNDSKVKVLNHIQVDNPQQVLLDVKVAQVKKTALKELGLSMFARGASAEGFSNPIGAGGAPRDILEIRDAAGNIISKGEGIAATHPGLANINPLDPYQLGVSIFNPGIGAVLKALVTKDMAKILAEPNLLVKSGQEGRFLAGSRIPVSVLSAVGGAATPSIYWIDVGVKLNFKPKVLENGLISLKMDPAEVSSISGTLAVNGYPIIDTREIRSNVELRDGESLVLAGLLQEETIKSMSKIPLLGDIPILGALFRSTQDSINETELVFFITPKLVTPNAPGVVVELPTDKKLTPEQEKELQWIPLPK